MNPNEKEGYETVRRKREAEKHWEVTFICSYTHADMHIYSRRPNQDIS